MSIQKFQSRLQGNWWIIIYGTCFLWVLPISLLMVGAPSSVIQQTAIYGWFIAWIVMPIALYDDIKFVRNTSSWEPKLWLYVVLALIPLIAVISGTVYLGRRHMVLDVP